MLTTDPPICLGPRRLRRQKGLMGGGVWRIRLDFRFGLNKIYVKNFKSCVKKRQKRNYTSADE